MLRRIVRDALFPGHARIPDPYAGEGLERLERLRREVEGGSVEAWLLHARPTPEPAPAVVFAHGNAELIDDWADALAPLTELGMHVLLPEYRGYGRSGGEPSQASIAEDFVRFVERIAARDEVDASRIVYVGRSLGGGVACALATRIPPRALVLMSTFTSARAMARRYLVPGLFVDDPFDNLDAVRRLRVPLLVVHGVRDDLVPLAHARMLAAAAQDSKLVLYDAGHNDCPPEWGAFYAELKAFFVRTGVLHASPAPAAR